MRHVQGIFDLAKNLGITRVERVEASGHAKKMLGRAVLFEGVQRLRRLACGRLAGGFGLVARREEPVDAFAIFGDRGARRHKKMTSTRLQVARYTLSRKSHASCSALVWTSHSAEAKFYFASPSCWPRRKVRPTMPRYLTARPPRAQGRGAAAPGQAGRGQAGSECHRPEMA